MIKISKLNCYGIGILLFLIFLFSANQTQARYPADPKIDQQWYLKQVNAPQAWDIVQGSSEIVVAVIDSGVDIYHPDLVDNIWTNENEIPNDGVDNDNNGYIDDIQGWDFLNNTANPNPKYTLADNENLLGVSHGTIVSGIIAARGDNKKGISGISWRSKIMPLRVLDNQGRGTASLVSKAIEYAINNGAHVINLSFVGAGKSSIIEKAVKKAYEAGLVVVAAAGNGTNQYQNIIVNLNKYPGAPICSASQEDDRKIVVGVASTDTLDQKAPFSNYGSTCVDISAPGYGFYATVVQDLTIGSKSHYAGLFSGTSLSAPIVSGAAALLFSLDLDISNKEIIDAILKSASPLAESNSEYKYNMGTGGLDIRAAVERALKIHAPKKYIKALKKYLPNAKVVISSNGPYSSDMYVYDMFDEFAIKDKVIESYPFRFKGGVSVTASSVLDFNIYTIPGESGGPQLLNFDAFGHLRSMRFINEDSQRSGNSIDLGYYKIHAWDTKFLAFGSGINQLPEVTIRDTNGNYINHFDVYAPNYRKGVKVVTGDVNGDGIDEIITGTMKGGGPHVRVFNIKGDFVSHFFSGSPKSRNGINIASCNVNLDSKDEIITGAAEGNIGIVSVFNDKGLEIYKFVPFESTYTGGISVSCADVNSDGIQEIIVGSGKDYDPTIAIFNKQGEEYYRFRPFSGDKYFGGLNIKAVN